MTLQSLPPPSLKEIKIEVTHRCLLTCIHCSSDAAPSNTVEMEKNICISIINQASKLGATSIAFSGGEPLLWPHIDDVVRFSIESGLDTSLYTTGNINGSLNRISSIAKSGLKRAIFSIFSHDVTSHERVTRTRGSYATTINAIKHCHTVGIRPEFHFVPFSYNYTHLSAIAELAKSLDISRVSVSRFVPQGRGQLISKYLLNKNQNIELKDTIKRLRKHGHDIRTGSPYNFLHLNNSPKCTSGFDRIIIGPDLRVYPCDAFKQIKAYELVGTDEFSVLADHNLSECWNESPFLNAVRNYLTTPFEKPCSTCKLLEKCLSGCLAQKVIHNSNLDKTPDPMCIL